MVIEKQKVESQVETSNEMRHTNESEYDSDFESPTTFITLRTLGLAAVPITRRDFRCSARVERQYQEFVKEYMYEFIDQLIYGKEPLDESPMIVTNQKEATCNVTNAG